MRISESEDGDRRQEAEFLYDRYAAMMKKTSNDMHALLADDPDLLDLFDASHVIESREEFVESVMILSDETLRDLQTVLGPESERRAQEFAGRLLSRLRLRQ